MTISGLFEGRLVALHMEVMWGGGWRFLSSERVVRPLDMFLGPGLYRTSPNAWAEVES